MSRPAIPNLGAGAASQIRGVIELVQGVLGEDAVGGYLYGSAVSGGLKPSSDLDVLVVSTRRTTPSARRMLIDGLLALSGPRARGGPGRHLEVTLVVRSDVRPWRYPPPMELQYGDWWRAEFERGDPQPWASPNPDLAVMLTTVRRDGSALFGPPPAEVLDPVPRADLDRSMLDGISGLLDDLDDDTTNVLLTLARMWVTLASGEIRSKDEAADWALERLPEQHRAALSRARAGYLAGELGGWDDLMPSVRADANVIVAELRRTAAERRGS